MSEYLKKQAVLEWLKEQQKQQEEKRDRLEIDHPYWEYHEGASDYLSLSVEKIQSSAFDADTSEVKRLRAIEQAIRDFQPTTDQRAGYDALVAWLESTTPFQAELDVPDESTAYGNDCRDGKCEW